MISISQNGGMAFRVFRSAVINMKPRILVFSIMSCLSVNRVVLIEAGSLIEARGSDTIVLLEEIR